MEKIAIDTDGDHDMADSAPPAAKEKEEDGAKEKKEKKKKRKSEAMEVSRLAFR